MPALTIQIEVHPARSASSAFAWTPRASVDRRAFEVECVFLDDHVRPRRASLGGVEVPFDVSRHPKEEEEPYLTSGISTLRVASAPLAADETLTLEFERVQLPESLLAHPYSRRTPLALAVCDPAWNQSDVLRAPQARFLDTTFRLHDLEGA